MNKPNRLKMSKLSKTRQKSPHKSKKSQLRKKNQKPKLRLLSQKKKSRKRKMLNPKVVRN
jgi:hypothetical protein